VRRCLIKEASGAWRRKQHVRKGRPELIRASLASHLCRFVLRMKIVVSRCNIRPSLESDKI
jgi:hypothetical protein